MLENIFPELKELNVFKICRNSLERMWNLYQIYLKIYYKEKVWDLCQADIEGKSGQIYLT